MYDWRQVALYRSSLSPVLTQRATHSQACDYSIPDLQVELEDERSLLRGARSASEVGILTDHQLERQGNPCYANERRDPAGLERGVQRAPDDLSAPGCSSGARCTARQ